MSTALAQIDNTQKDGIAIIGDQQATVDALLASGQRFEMALRIGSTLAQSRMFPDAKTAEEAVVKIMAGFEMGIGPMAAMQGIHVIRTGQSVNITLSANSMAAAIKANPAYDYDIENHDAGECDIDFYRVAIDGSRTLLGRSSFTIEEAKTAGLVKPNGNWMKYPKNMLFARAISNGYKWFCGDATGGIRAYTPDEVGQVVNEDGSLDLDKAEFAAPKALPAPEPKPDALISSPQREELCELVSWGVDCSLISLQEADVALGAINADTCKAGWAGLKIRQWRFRKDQYEKGGVAVMIEGLDRRVDAGEVAATDADAWVIQMKQYLEGKESLEALGHGYKLLNEVANDNADDEDIDFPVDPINDGPSDGDAPIADGDGNSPDEPDAGGSGDQSPVEHDGVSGDDAADDPDEETVDSVSGQDSEPERTLLPKAQQVVEELNDLRKLALEGEDEPVGADFVDTFRKLCGETKALRGMSYPLMQVRSHEANEAPSRGTKDYDYASVLGICWVKAIDYVLEKGQ